MTVYFFKELIPAKYQITSLGSSVANADKFLAKDIKTLTFTFMFR